MSLLHMTLWKPEDSRHEAKKTLTEHGKIYLEKENDKCKEITKRILLTAGVSTLFAANVSYNQRGYQKF